MTTLGAAWRTGRDRLAANGIATSALDAQVLLRHCLNIDTSGLIAREQEVLPLPDQAVFTALIDRRLKGEPVARIVGVQEFYGLTFGLNAATLIPRPETEMLVDFGIAHLRAKPDAKLLDLGTGTGCIAIALLANLPKARAVAVDVSAEALAQAKANGERNAVAGRLTLLEGNWFDPVAAGETFDLIVSNPPYIVSAVIDTLESGVKEHDPMAALDGGADGLDPYRIIAQKAHGHLASNGLLALEIGFDQGHMVHALLEQAGFSDIDVAKDLAGHHRMVTAKAQK